MIITFDDVHYGKISVDIDTLIADKIIDKIATRLLIDTCVTYCNYKKTDSNGDVWYKYTALIDLLMGVRKEFHNEDGD